MLLPTRHQRSLTSKTRAAPRSPWRGAVCSAFSAANAY